MLVGNVGIDYTLMIIDCQRMASSSVALFSVVFF